jgi:uncharacterized protein (DUF433 family)
LSGCCQATDSKFPLFLPSSFTPVWRGFSVEGARIRRNRPAANRQFSLAQGLKHPQLFRHGPSGQSASQGAFAFENFLRVQAHETSLKNCRSNLCQASRRLWSGKKLLFAFASQGAYDSTMNERIEINPRVCGGQPVIKGTRIAVAKVLEQLADDESWDSLLRGYPELERNDIQAALEYARNSILHTEVSALDAA